MCNLSSSQYAWNLYNLEICIQNAIRRPTRRCNGDQKLIVTVWETQTFTYIAISYGFNMYCVTDIYGNVLELLYLNVFIIAAIFQVKYIVTYKSVHIIYSKLK